MCVQCAFNTLSRSVFDMYGSILPLSLTMGSRSRLLCVCVERLGHTHIHNYSFRMKMSRDDDDDGLCMRFEHGHFTYILTFYNGSAQGAIRHTFKCAMARTTYLMGMWTKPSGALSGVGWHQMATHRARVQCLVSARRWQATFDAYCLV